MPLAVIQASLALTSTWAQFLARYPTIHRNHSQIRTLSRSFRINVDYQEHQRLLLYIKCSRIFSTLTKLGRTTEAKVAKEVLGMANIKVTVQLKAVVSRSFSIRGWAAYRSNIVDIPRSLHNTTITQAQRLGSHLCNSHLVVLCSLRWLGEGYQWPRVH
jgi:hypothetical protein